MTVYHLDLYRLADPEELEFLGGREIFGGDNLVLVEWPERGMGWLPRADMHVEIRHESEGRRLEIRCEDEVFAELQQACDSYLA
jgi:tRNA threonylcarbamoyladenosine biosynthesis protein TsaE